MHDGKQDMRGDSSLITCSNVLGDFWEFRKSDLD